MSGNLQLGFEVSKKKHKSEVADRNCESGKGEVMKNEKGRKGRLAVFVPRATVLTGFLIFLFWRIPWFMSGFGVPYARLSARIVGWMINLFGGDVAVYGIRIKSEVFPMAVAPKCLALEPSALFAACVLCFPSSWRSKAWGLIAGLVVIHVANALRMVALYFVGARNPGFWHTAHIHVSQPLMVLLVVALWLAWLEMKEPAAGERRENG